MNERRKALSEGRLSRTALHSVAEVKAAIQRNLGGHNYGVYAFPKGCCMAERVIGARTHNGQFEVKSIKGAWFMPGHVWVEG